MIQGKLFCSFVTLLEAKMRVRRCTSVPGSNLQILFGWVWVDNRDRERNV
jgi:hypothetical protein